MIVRLPDWIGAIRGYGGYQWRHPRCGNVSGPYRTLTAALLAREYHAGQCEMRDAP